MSNTVQNIVQKLWGLCNVLRDDGITYHQYVTELTYLLFLKMTKETNKENQIPEGYRWDDLYSNREGAENLVYYKKLMLTLEQNGSKLVKKIFSNSSTSLRQPKNLQKLIESMNDLDWHDAKEESFGDLYEGLLEKNAAEKKSGAGQYFTPRALIDSIVELMEPKPGETIQDPALGTAGFLVAANNYMKEKYDDYFDLSADQQKFQRQQAFYGCELVPDTHRLALMNTMLNDIEGHIECTDTLSPEGAKLPKVDLILSNPPFGTKTGGGKPSRDDFTFETSNKQLAFLQHIYRALKPGARAAVVLPDNVLFEDGVGQSIRQDLMDKCNLHTILRLPTGIFYAQGVKTNVLFFTRGKTEKNNTLEVWFYDMRINMPKFGKRTPLTREHFQEFEEEYQKKQRIDGGEKGRFCKFTREEIAKRDDNLDISWLQDNSVRNIEDLPEPEEIANEILLKLQLATKEINTLKNLLES